MRAKKARHYVNFVSIFVSYQVVLFVLCHVCFKNISMYVRWLRAYSTRVMGIHAFYPMASMRRGPEYKVCTFVLFNAFSCAGGGVWLSTTKNAILLYHRQLYAKQVSPNSPYIFKWRHNTFWVCNPLGKFLQIDVHSLYGVLLAFSVLAIAIM